MNNAGLPGTGLGGFLYIVLGLVMPVRELYLTLRGRSSPERWGLVGRQFFIACGVLAGVEVASWALAWLLPAELTPRDPGGTLFLALPIAVSACMLVVVVTGIRLWALGNRLRARLSRRQRRALSPL